MKQNVELYAMWPIKCNLFNVLFNNFPSDQKVLLKIDIFTLNFKRYKGSIFEIKLINNVDLNNNAIAYDNFKCY